MKVGIDSAGEQVWRVSGSSTYATFDVNNSGSFAFEFDSPVSDTMDFGGGVEFQVARELTGYAGQFKFMPVYGYLRLHPAMSDMTPYLVMQLGFSLFVADDIYTGTLGETQSGMHLGLGGGIILDKNFIMELLYTVDTGSILYPSPVPDMEIEYSKLTMSVGFVF
ncbi:MAG: hypothetical protein A2X56_01785 [Nitrospirae bacterium GWC2_57_13]|nr:MAG: hypothetical protein A2X56_01785 [Nitrospirae bacterium GWC2_57_13]HAS54696.1 hypothetical protein [Nitrospiraceae bacterium]